MQEKKGEVIKSKKKAGWTGAVLMYLLYSVLLLWPVYTVLSYKFLPAGMRTILPVTLMVVEAGLGVLCILSAVGAARKNLRLPTVAGLILMILTFAAYLASILYIFVLQMI